MSDPCYFSSLVTFDLRNSLAQTALLEEMSIAYSDNVLLSIDYTGEVAENERRLQRTFFSAVQGQPRSLILVLIESAYATSY